MMGLSLKGKERSMKTVIAMTLCAVSWTALAQVHQPYAGQSGREIKALSDEEVRQYLSGAGMGYAKAAELNHYPGPMHVLELADRLALSSEQERAIRELMNEHKVEARAIGARLVQSERALEMIFLRSSADGKILADVVSRTASLQGQYRLSHLETHRRTRELLTDAQ